MTAKLVWTALIVAVAVALAACTSTPQASVERDAQAKQFSTHPNAAAIYVYRSNFNRQVQMDDDSVLYMDDRLIGTTLPGAYFRIDAVPGRHLLHGIGADAGSISVDARPGEIYFVRLDVQSGVSHFRLEPEKVARAQINICCALLENWAPGQRPLLR